MTQLKIETIRCQVIQLILFLSITGLGAAPAFALPQSINVAYIDTLSVINGGSFPTTTAGPTGSFTDFNFFRATITNVSTADLGPNGVCGVDACDTVLLNVASSGIGCNVDRLTASQKSDLVNFVGAGGKLIIYDSECVTQNYSWLPYPFQTNNPGAQGAQGTLTIVEENTLSKTTPADTYYINSTLLGSSTDAVGDMNVMTTLDSNWFLDMSGTNINQVTGPVHTYARFGQGLLIYNGLDIDHMRTSTSPDAIAPSGNLAKIWLQELQVSFNPTPPEDLPSGATVVGINISPTSSTQNLSAGETQHTVTATVKDLLNNPKSGVLVTFTVISGPNVGVSGICDVNASCITDENGQVSFTYTNTGGLGNDEIQACFTDTDAQVKCVVATNDWVSQLSDCDLDADNDVDRDDVTAIFVLRGTPVPPADPIFDTDGDGLITVNDGRACVLRCTRPQCALQ